MSDKGNGATAQQLGARCAYWQQVLRLQDWDIHIAVKRERDMELDARSAEVTCHLPLRTAWITFLDPVDYPPNASERPDPELSLVHELLHLYTRPFDLPREGPKHIAEEQMIEGISRALVKLERQRSTRKKG